MWQRVWERVLKLKDEVWERVLKLKHEMEEIFQGFLWFRLTSSSWLQAHSGTLHWPPFQLFVRLDEHRLNKICF